MFIAGISSAVAGGLLLGHSTTSVMGCGQTNCSVGGAGTGGEASDGAAQGSHTVNRTNPIGAITTSGTGTSGRTTFDAVDGGPQIADGRIDPELATGRGHFVNTVIGDCNGQCPH